MEGHGTGTPVGDKIELTALNNVFSSVGKREARREGRRRKHQEPDWPSEGSRWVCRPCEGHPALKHKVLPKTINVKTLPNLVDGKRVQESALYINTKMRPWFTAPGNTRRAGVSSFGFGGANYHCVLEEFQSEHTKAKKPYRMHAVDQGFVISGNVQSACSDALQVG